MNEKNHFNILQIHLEEILNMKEFEIIVKFEHL